MRLRIVVYLRPKTVKILLAKKQLIEGEKRDQKWLSLQLGTSQAMVSLMLRGVAPVPSSKGPLLWDMFRGMSHKHGGRLKDSDLFQYAAFEQGKRVET